MSKTSTIKSISVDQFNYAIQRPSIDFEAYALAGSAPGNVQRIPPYYSVPQRPGDGFGPESHPNWLDLVDFAPHKPSEVGGKYETSDGFGQIMDSMTCKDADLGRNGEFANQQGFAGQRDSFAHTYFPVVFRQSPAFIKTTGLITNDYEKIIVVPFRVVASTWPWIANDSDRCYKPEYKMEQQIRDGVRIDLNVDMRYLDDNDDQWYSSLLASVMSVLPSRWSASMSSDNVLPVYLTIAPAISNEDYEKFVADCVRIMGTNAPRPDNCFRFSGPSLGLAVLAAIMGMPPIMYTGFNSQVGQNLIIGENDTIQEVALGANMVDPIEDFEYKTAAAILIGVPIIIPLNYEWHAKSAREAIHRGISLALGHRTGQQTLLALAAKEYGYPQNMQKAIALANSSTNWAMSMSEFIFTTAKRAAGFNFNQLPSLILAATNLSDVQILAAHAIAYLWNPNGSNLIRRTRDGGIAGKYESAELARMKAQTTRAFKLAAKAGGVHNVEGLRGQNKLRAKIMAGPDDRAYTLDGLFVVPRSTYTDGSTESVARKVVPKRSGGRSSGTMKARGKAAGTKKKAPKKKKATKKKAAPKKKKGGKKAGKKGKKKKPLGKASGSILLSVAAAKKKKKKKGKKGKGKKKAAHGRAAGIKKAKKSKKAKKPKKTGKKKSKSKKTHKKKLSYGRSAGYRVLGTSRRGASSSMSAKQIMQRALAKARGKK